MTELSPVSHVVNPSLKNTKIGSCGTPVASTLCKVVDPETGVIFGPHQPGELCVKGPQVWQYIQTDQLHDIPLNQNFFSKLAYMVCFSKVMKGYFKNDEATAQTIDSDGWLHTGDIAYYDEDSCFYIVDRLKELIKVKGFQVKYLYRVCCFKNCQLSVIQVFSQVAPSELEDLLRKHEKVSDVAVIGVPNEEFGELPRYEYIMENMREIHTV